MISNLAYDIADNHRHHPRSDLDIVHSVRRGLMKNQVFCVQDRLELADEEIAVCLRISPRTLARYKKDLKTRLPSTISGALESLAHLYDKACNTFGSEDKARTWLKTSCVTLGGMTPLSLLDTSVGIRMVENELTRIDYGVFS